MGNNISISRLQEVLRYDPETGKVFWKIKTCRKVVPGNEAGSSNKRGRVYVAVDGKHMLLARVIWAVSHGEWPNGDIDHINGNPSDNRSCNLRLASKTQNMANKKMHKNNKAGVKGVHWCHQRKKWKACVIKDRKKHHAGFYTPLEDAGQAYINKAKELYGEFATNRRA